MTTPCLIYPMNFLRCLTSRASFDCFSAMPFPMRTVLSMIALVGFSHPAIGADLFADKNLEAAVRLQVLAKRNGKEPLTAADVSKVSEVKASGKGIVNLKGLEACKELASLELPGNAIEDLSPLRKLGRLQVLDLSDNKVQNAAPLRLLHALQYLNLERNRIQNIGPLSGLSNLRSLYLTGNRLKDVRPLGKLTKLWSLYLGNNQLEDVSALRAMTGLVHLGLEGNRIEDLSPLAKMDHLGMLFLQNNRIEDLNVLAKAVKHDAEGPRRFGPFLQVFLKGNPVGPEDPQVKELTKWARKVDFTYE